jgi:hypothetical protein
MALLGIENLLSIKLPWGLNNPESRDRIAISCAPISSGFY